MLDGYNTTSVWNVTGATEAPPIGLDHPDALLIHPYVNVKPAAAIPYLVVAALALALGTVGNVLILGAYAVSKQVRTTGSEFIFNLGIADLLVSTVAGPMCIIGVTHGRQYFVQKPILCKTIGVLCLSACFCTFFSLSFVTLSRYTYICHNNAYKVIFCRRNNVLMCILAWVLAIGLELPNLLGWGAYEFDTKQLKCDWSRMASFSYTLFVTIGLIATTLCLMTIAYCRIFFYIRNSKRKIIAQSMISASEGCKKELKETIKSCRTLFAVVIAFVVCWTPYCLVVALDIKDTLPVDLHLWVALLAHIHSSINCLIYGFTAPNFRLGYRKFLCVIFCRSLKTVQQPK